VVAHEEMALLVTDHPLIFGLHRLACTQL
jgi:hypothetical protein